MRACNNCAYRLKKKNSNQDLCIKIGNLCRVAVGYPDRDSCTDHQLAESELIPVLDEAVELLKRLLDAMSPPNCWRAERFISAHSHLCTRDKFSMDSWDYSNFDVEVKK